MALETLTRQTAARAGAQLNMQSITTVGGFKFPNDGHTALVVANDAGALALVFTLGKTVDGQTVTRTISVTASQTWIIGPFPVDLYNDSSDYVFCTPDADLASGVGVVSI